MEIKRWKERWYFDFWFTVLVCCLITMVTIIFFVFLQHFYGIPFFILFPLCIVLLFLEIELTCWELTNILKSREI